MLQQLVNILLEFAMYNRSGPKFYSKILDQDFTKRMRQYGNQWTNFH
jgi:hypothetical protein